MNNEWIYSKLRHLFNVVIKKMFRLSKNMLKPLMKLIIRNILIQPFLKKFASKLLMKYPRFKQRLHQFAFASGLLNHTKIELATNDLSPYTYRIYLILKNLIEQKKKLDLSLLVESQPVRKVNNKKPSLAFVSPLPPERTGIANYSAELLVELMQHYEIDLITDQINIILPVSLFSLTSLTKRSIRWFSKNSAHYDRIIYHFGNSPFHSHMLSLLSQHPGIVVLHDFFLSHMMVCKETGNMFNPWTKALFHSHGYTALQSCFEENKIEHIKNFYPCNLEVLQNAKRIIVHSKYSQQLARQWYGKGISDNWTIIPLLRAPVELHDRRASRNALGINENSFVVCSFGFIGPSKLNHRLLKAWLSSKLRMNCNCELILVGANHEDDYGLTIADCIRNNKSQSRIRITGWVEKKVYDYYLQAADIGVQLRSISRGETSSAVLDCMNYGLATIVNANGTMAELPSETVWMLPDNFTDADLVFALETLWKNQEKRKQLSARGREYITKEHNPKLCANRYVEIIESIYQQSSSDKYTLTNTIASIDTIPSTDSKLKDLAKLLANSCKVKPIQKQLLIDVTTIVRNDLKTGIERVVRAQLLELIKTPPFGYRVEPVYLIKENGLWQYRYAREYALKILGIPTTIDLQNSIIDIYPEDIFYAADFAPQEIIAASKAGLFLKWRQLGVQINILIYDLLPILQPQFFPRGADISHSNWLKEIVRFADRLIGISNSVTKELQDWLNKNSALSSHPLKITAVPLGADITKTAPTLGLSKPAIKFLKKLKQRISFLMVGTIEPRKGHLQTLAAFEALWQKDYQVTLVIVGKEGWLQVPENERRTIPEIVKKLRTHPKLEKQLFWLEEATDEFLEKLYSTCTCLLVPSEGEGFGLPLIEAARYKLPSIVRDLPVFREVALENAYYFNGMSGIELANAISNWLNLYKNGNAPAAAKHYYTWEQNVKRLTSVLLEKV